MKKGELEVEQMFSSLPLDVAMSILGHSNVFKEYLSKIKNLNAEQVNLANNRYITAAYFHTIFLYAINKSQKFQISKGMGPDEKPIELDEYLVELFKNHYAAFLLNFQTKDLMDGLN